MMRGWSLPAFALLIGRHIQRVRFGYRLFKAFDRFAQTFTELRNFPRTENNEHDDEDEHKLHPSKRSKHIKPRICVGLGFPKKDAEVYTTFFKKSTRFQILEHDESFQVESSRSMS
jgi:hypothetical protein